MQRTFSLLLFASALMWPAPKQRSWADAVIAKLDRTVAESETLSFAHRTSEDAPTGPVSNGIEKRYSTRWVLTIKSKYSVWVGAADGSTPPGQVHEGDRVRVAIEDKRLYLATQPGKEVRLDLLSSLQAR